MSELTFSQMTDEQLMEAALLSAEAFYDYEYIVNYIADEKRRKIFMNCMISADLKVNRKLSTTFVAMEKGTIVAVATLYRPGAKRASTARYLAEGCLKAIVRGGIKDSIAWIDMDTKAHQPCFDIKKDAWYLGSLSVGVAHQGAGVGSAFMQKCLIPYVRENGGQELCLVTNSEINRKFYEKNGFKEFHHEVFRYRGKELGSWCYSIRV